MAAEGSTDPAALFDALVEAGVFDVDPDTDEVTLTPDFDATLTIYDDTYGSVADEEFHRTLAEVFGLEDAETAADRADELGVTREELAAFLALRSHLEEPPEVDRLAVMAAMVTDVEVGSPVPAELEELTDATYRGYIDEHGDVVVTVWRHRCDPCDALKRDLDEIMAAAPASVRFAGVDGEETVDIRKAFAIEAAPTTLAFRDGELVDRIRGRRPVQDYEALFADVYG